jgi:hypothetical protein
MDQQKWSSLGLIWQIEIFILNLDSALKIAESA